MTHLEVIRKRFDAVVGKTFLQKLAAITKKTFLNLSKKYQNVFLTQPTELELVGTLSINGVKREELKILILKQ